jgi:hypothetical protein
MNPVLELVLQASSQLWNPSLPRAPTLSSIHKATRIENHQNVGKMKKKCKMNPVLELVLQASNQLWNSLVTEVAILSSIH